MVTLPLSNRTAAGRQLAQKLLHYADRSDVIVLALPRGGVPVANEIALALNAPLDVIIVRKLGLPSHDEFAMGAIASDGIYILIDEVIGKYQIADQDIEQVVQREQRELDRRQLSYRGDRPWPDLRGRCVILVDDGIATGATMRAAMQATRAQAATHIVIAVPLAPADTLEEISNLADEVVCLVTPVPFYAVSQGYVTFDQISDKEVLTVLNKMWQK